MTQSKTFQGIKFIMIALLLDLVMGVFGIITAISSFVGSEMGMGSGGGIMGSTPDTEAMMANLGLLCLVLLLTGLAFLGWLTLMIVGLVKIYQGRHEFDQEHSKKVKTGMILLIIGLALTFVVGLAGIICVSLGLIFLINRIAQPKHRTMLWVGFVFICFSAFLGLLNLIMIFVFWDNAAVLGGFSLSIALFDMMGVSITLMAYNGTYKGIKEGIIQPVMMPTYMMPPPGYGGSLPPDQFSPQYPPGDHLAAYVPPPQHPPPPEYHQKPPKFEY